MRARAGRVQAAVGPGDPHQREHRRKLAEPAPCQVPGQVAGGLGDHHDHGEVAEELKRADHALARLRAVRARRLPQGTAQPGPALAARGCAGAGLGGRDARAGPAAWPRRSDSSRARFGSLRHTAPPAPLLAQRSQAHLPRLPPVAD